MIHTPSSWSMIDGTAVLNIWLMDLDLTGIDFAA